MSDSKPDLATVPPRPPGAEPPVELKGTKQKERYKVAAGFKALTIVAEEGLRQAGPVRTVRTALQLNQVDGFDCQSCAWPSPDDHRSVAEFCENGFKAVAFEADKRRLTRKFFREHSVADLAERSEHWLGEQGRLTEPMVLRPGSEHYQPISWEEAFGMVAGELRALASPDEAVFYTSGRANNESAFLYQLLIRAYGTNNMPDCSNMCHESSSVGLPLAIGIGKGCVKLEDFPRADAIFIFGNNPGTNHPRMLTSLQEAKENGCKIVSINPLPETGTNRFKNPQDLLHPTRIPRFLFGGGTTMADLWLPVRINGDMALLHGMMKEMLAAEEARPGTVFDHDFIRQHTHGYEELIAQIRRSSWEDIVRMSGLSREQIRQAADIALAAKNTIVIWCMGITQHRNAVATIHDIVSFLLLRGNIGRPGAGPCPVRGHSNVQGDRTMGIWDRPKKEFLDKLESVFGIKAPREEGFDTVAAIEAMHDGRAKVFFALGGNFLSAGPDTERMAEALRRCRLTVQVSIKLNRSHLVTGSAALILPCLGRSEIDRQASGPQFMTVEDSMGIINPTRGVLKPASPHLLSEPAIVAGIAKELLGPRNPIDWDAHVANYDLIRDRIEAVIPGFGDFNRRIRQGTFYLPNPPRDERRFATATGKANFLSHPLSAAEAGESRYLLGTMRSHDQFNTTIYGLDDRYRGIYNGRRVIFMNPQDVAAAGLVQGQLVDITSHFKGEERRAERFMIAPYDIPRGCTAGYYPELNVLVPLASVAEASRTPTSKSIEISVRPSADQTRFE